MGNSFSFGGRECTELGLSVQYYPEQKKPRRKTETIAIPGRNGELRISSEVFENVQEEYDCYFKGGPDRAAEVAAWLFSAGESYARLEDTYNPLYFRMAAFDGPLDVENVLNRYGRCVLRFNRKPQLFLKSGEQWCSFQNSGGVLDNPTRFEALPLVKILGEGQGEVSISGCVVQILYIDGELTLDCDILNAYKGTENKNGDIYAPEFPTLKPGDNTIAWTGGISGVEIIPRWWTL